MTVAEIIRFEPAPRTGPVPAELFHLSDRPGDGAGLFIARDALITILSDAKSLDDARRMAGEAIGDIDDGEGGVAA